MSHEWFVWAESVINRGTVLIVLLLSAIHLVMTLLAALF